MKPQILRAFVAVHAAGVVVVAALAIATWRIRCEGFGCVGVGIAWFAWSCLFAAWLAIGFVAHRSCRADPSWSRVARGSLWAQAIVGLVPFLYWAGRGAA
ncbi:MAG: hypothetical protein U1F48_13815 [Burkholderiales bacterium]